MDNCVKRGTKKGPAYEKRGRPPLRAQPLGPSPNSQDANTIQSASYTKGQLMRLRNSSRSKNTLSGDTVFLEKLNLLGILRKGIKVTAKSPGPFFEKPNLGMGDA